MTDQPMQETILDALREVAPDIDPQTIQPEVAFRDQAEIDSVDFVNFVLALEDRLGRRIPEYDYPKLSSLNGCLAYLGNIHDTGSDRHDRGM
ncbi:acyl carrier protein [Arhodomonas sp. AD133]|uniref:acyl carrier protein n=1 Tax=Arhodomonas sp. AD133 TaxID=3415009 RepID=UPI003EBA45EE